MRRRLELMQLEMGISTRRYLPARGTAGLARSFVNGKRRVPCPPPMITESTLLVFADCRPVYDIAKPRGCSIPMRASYRPLSVQRARVICNEYPKTSAIRAARLGRFFTLLEFSSLLSRLRVTVTAAYGAFCRGLNRCRLGNANAESCWVQEFFWREFFFC